ncbi:MAG: RodZ domain-containing protein [Thermoanaerobaculia bacterium]
MSTPPVRSTKVAPAGQEAAQARAAFGQWLRQQRAVRDIELDEVARATKVSIRYLEALEGGRFELLPAPVFARGFLREYARYVGLDADEAVNSYLTALQLGGAEEAPRSEVAAPERRRLAAAIGIVVGLALVVIGIWWWLNRHQASERQTVPASSGQAALPRNALPAAGESPPSRQRTRSAAEPTQAPEEASTAPLVVTLDFRAGSWVEAEVDGQPMVSEERLQGESLTLQAQRRVLLSLDRPQAVDVLVNGEPVTIAPGPDGAVRDHEIALPPPPEAAQE